MIFSKKITNGKKKKSTKKELVHKNIILKGIKEYPKVTHHREKWFWEKNDI